MTKYKCKVGTDKRVRIPMPFFKELGLFEEQQVEITIEYGNLVIKRFNWNEPAENRPYIGLVRRLNRNRTISIPIEFLEILDMKPSSTVEAKLEGEKIIFEKVKQDLE